MCEQCNAKVEEVRPMVHRLVCMEREARQLFPHDTEAQHTTRLADVISEMIAVPTEHGRALDLTAVILGYAIAIQKFIALEAITGMAP